MEKRMDVEKPAGLTALNEQPQQKFLDEERSPPKLKTEYVDGCPTFEMAGIQWRKECIEEYVIIMNFVNWIQAKGVATAAFEMRREDHMMGFWRGDSPSRKQVKELHNDGALVLVALGFHNLNKMGGTHAHILAALNTWLPNIHMDQCPLYLEACYEIFTAKSISLTSGKAVHRQ
jgi:hypothetical protein